MWGKGLEPFTFKIPRIRNVESKVGKWTLLFLNMFQKIRITPDVK